MFRYLKEVLHPCRKKKARNYLNYLFRLLLYSQCSAFQKNLLLYSQCSAFQKNLLLYSQCSAFQKNPPFRQKTRRTFHARPRKYKRKQRKGEHRSKNTHPSSCQKWRKCCGKNTIFHSILMKNWSYILKISTPYSSSREFHCVLSKLWDQEVGRL